MYPYSLIPLQNVGHEYKLNFICPAIYVNGLKKSREFKTQNSVPSSAVTNKLNMYALRLTQPYAYFIALLLANSFDLKMSSLGQYLQNLKMLVANIIIIIIIIIIAIIIIIIIIITKVIPVIIGATGTISKSFRKYVSNVPGNHEVKELQKTAILGTAHILRKVLM